MIKYQLKVPCRIKAFNSTGPFDMLFTKGNTIIVTKMDLDGFVHLDSGAYISPEEFRHLKNLSTEVEDRPN